MALQLADKRIAAKENKSKQSVSENTESTAILEFIDQSKF